ncbi:hypothetical protein [Erythrobacter tepidarius]|uniref:hypothetical protein n=1 Tax=Erythrobacter tepidarius TaxID=60454 RepID=UPI000A3D216D|nr:hypothetical protein [Erythrobacter tepidarius]
MNARHVLSLPALAAAGLLVATAVPAAAKDASIEQRLDAQGTKYEIDEDGDYKIVVSWKNEGRTQIVFVSGKTEEVAGLVIREVFAPAAIIEKHDINGKQALALLEAAGQTKIGSWEVRGGVLYFVAKVLDSLSAEQLDAVITVISETADDKEIELTGGKDDL